MNDKLDPKTLANDVRPAQNGDPDAMNRLLASVQDMVYYSCLRMLRNEAEAQDAAQDVLITIYRKIRQLSDPLSFLGWVKRIVANRCKDRLSKANREFLLSETEDGKDELAFIEDLDEQRIPDKVLDNAETRRMVIELIDRLPDEQRACVILYYYNEMKTREIAEALGVSEGTVKSRLNYARKAIKAGVDEYEKQGVKLYGLSPLLFLSYFLRSAGSAVRAPFTVAVPGSAAAGASGASASGGASAGNTASAATHAARRSAQAAKAASVSGKAAAGTAAKAASSGFDAFLSTAVGKVVAAVAVAGILGGATVGAVFAVKGMQKDAVAQETIILSSNDANAADHTDDDPIRTPPPETTADPTPSDVPSDPTPSAVPYDPTPVVFQNADFEAAFREAYGFSGTISRSDILSVTSLRLPASRLTDISDAAMFENLTELDLSGNKIADLSAVSGLTNLTVLRLSDCNISSINALRDLVDLEELDLSDNFFSELPALKGMTRLKHLDLSSNPISSISALSGLTELKYLDLHMAMIQYIGALSNLTKLEYLDLSYNEVQSYDVLGNLTALKKLNVSNNPMSKKQREELSAALPDCVIRY